MTRRTQGAIILGVALVAIAFVLSRYIGPQAARTQGPVVVASPTLTTKTFKSPLPVTDSNNDGVPDWQELLQKTEPLILPKSEPFKEPETLTDQFALEFFERYVRNEGFGAFGQSPEAIIETASDELVAQTRDVLYTEKNIRLYQATPGQVRTYGIAVADIILAYPLPDGTRNEIEILEDAVAQNNATVLKELAPIQAAYEAMVEDMLALPVPQQLMKQHLDLTNTYQALAASLDAMQNTFNDPLLALLRLQRYQQDADGLAAAVNNLFNAAYRANANFQPGDSVFNIVESNQ